MTPERLLALVLAHSPGFAEPVGGGRPLWTILEAAWGCAGLSSDRVAAFWWRFARDDRSRTVLETALMDEAVRIAEREQWPKRIAGELYVGALVELVIAEEIMSEIQRERLQQRLEQLWGPTWQGQIARKHRAIGAILDRWCTDGHEHIARRIRENADD